ncbi:hypothetical protein ACFWP5_40470 [Streptomyces sp. NPDC058469]|uniref:hypothetical protein n=1 Tax=Streptomyces sp. NPDC058469 TaxID=3346514 RepID=UPI003661F211
MPDDLTIRLLKPSAWLKLSRREEKKFLIREIKELELGPQAAMQANRTLKDRHRNRVASHAMIGAQTVQDKHGRPHILLLPENLDQAGLLGDDDYLCKTVGHELVHGTQHEASKGWLFTLQDSFFPHLRRTLNVHWGFLMEGHAIWADRQITTRLLGYEVSLGVNESQASPQYLEALRQVEGREEALQMYLDGARAVSDIVQTHGLESFNRLWADRDLLFVPTFHQAENPSQWCERFSTADASSRS